MSVPPSAASRPVETIEAFVGLLGGVGDGDGRTFYDRLAEAACQTSDLDRALVIRYDPGQRRVRTAGGFGIEVEPYARVPLSLDSADIAREALLEDRVIEAHPPFDAVLPAAFLPVANAGPLVCVPMCASGRPIGVVIGQRRGATAPLDDAQRHALWTLGKVAALAATARIATYQQSRARSLQERIDLARDVHERVVQRLFGVSLALSARELDDRERERCASEIGDALGDLRAALQRPLSADERFTTSTLSEELDRLAAEPLPLEIEGDPGVVPARLQALAQDVLHEAIVNARKHADAEHLRVSVALRDGALVLEIANDGVRPAGGPRGTGMGLRLASFSALSHGGLLEFGPRGERGWQVRLVVPA